MISNRRTSCLVRQWSTGAGLLAAAIVDLFLPPGIADAAGTVDPSPFADLLSSIGL